MVDMKQITLHAAAVEVDITPPVGVFQDGYGSRTQPSQGIHDPLFATLLFLEREGQKLVLISLDQVGIQWHVVQRIRAGVSDALEVPSEAVLVACTHTHSGPAGFMESSVMLRFPPDPGLEEMLVRKITGAAIWAKQRLRPASISLSNGDLRTIGSNRNDPINGPSDPQLTLILVQDEEQQPMAMWVNYGCHPTVMGGDNLLISADYPGAARAMLRKIYPQAVFMFTNGASGDVSTRFTRRGQGFNEVERFGSLLASEVLQLIQLAEPVDAPVLAAVEQEVALKFRHFPPLETALSEQARLEKELAALKKSGAAAGDIRIATTRWEGATAQVIMAREYGGRVGSNSRVQALRIGPLALVGLPGEPFTRTVLEIKQQAGLKAAVVSYANDYQGYFPDAGSVAAGTYEALVSPFPAETAETMRDTALSLIEKLAKL